MHYVFNGIGIELFNKRQQAVCHIAGLIRQKKKIRIVTLNPEIMVRVWRNPKLYDLVKRADVVVIDGIGLQIAVSIELKRRVGRVPGADLFIDLLNYCAREGWGVFLLGATPRIIERATEAFIKLLPNLRIVGVYHGYSRLKALVNNLVETSGAEVVFIGLGFPLQEQLGEKIIDTTFVKTVMGVGGTFDYWGGGVRRAPRLLRRLGLEWLWRLILQPWRLPRIINAVLVFPALALKHTLSSKRHEH